MGNGEISKFQQNSIENSVIFRGYIEYNYQLGIEQCCLC